MTAADCRCIWTCRQNSETMPHSCCMFREPLHITSSHLSFASLHNNRDVQRHQCIPTYLYCSLLFSKGSPRCHSTTTDRLASLLTASLTTRTAIRWASWHKADSWDVQAELMMTTAAVPCTHQPYLHLPQAHDSTATAALCCEHAGKEVEGLAA